MAKFNAENERIKHKYLEWEKEARGKSEATITNIREALYLFDEYTGFKNFKQINTKDIIVFKNALKQKRNLRTGAAVSNVYLFHTSTYLISFFQWLYSQKGYKQKISPTDIDYFNLSAKDKQIARSPRSKRYPTLEQIEHVIKNMPIETDIQKRNRALIAFFALTGGRVTAVTSLKLEHISLENERVEQNPQEVKTKNSKKIVTFFYPVGDLIKGVVIDWVNFLKKERKFGFEAPLFPNTKLSLDANDQFSRQELDSVVWKSATSVRVILKQAFEAAEVEYYNPHSFRHTVAQLGYKFCKTPEDYKAWSQNLGHSSPLTTFTSYGQIDECTQGEIIKRLGKNDDEKPVTIKDIEKLLAQKNNGY